MLEVSHGHKINFQTLGNPEGIPLVFLHGGPGGRYLENHKAFFDLNDWFVIFYDQRGCGNSLPFASVENNNTRLLVEDLNSLRKKLNIEKWVLFGGSWGSTLALYYGILFPQHCMGFVLRGIFLGTKSEVNWFLSGMRKFYPEAHKKFLKSLNFNENALPNSSEILLRAKKLIFDSDPEIHLPAAEAWASYESSCSTLEYSLRRLNGSNALSLARIEIHYFLNNCFFKKNEILNNVKNISKIDTYIIQGRHDVICPPSTAYKLNEKIEKSEIIISENSGHSAFEEGNLYSIKTALTNLLKKIKRK